MQAGDRPFGDAVGGVDGGCIGCFDEVLRDDVYDAFARVDEVAERVFCVVEAAGVADAEDWRVVVHDRGVAKGGKVGGGACVYVRIE